MRIKAVLRLSTVRQTLGLLALFMGITLLAWGGTYWLVQREMLNAVDARLSLRMDEAATALARGRALPVAEDGQTAAIAPDDWPDGFLTVDSDGPGPEMRYLLRKTSHGRILLGENTERQDELRDILAGGMQVTLVASLLAALLAGLWMARRGQRRLGAINAGLAQVAQGRLSTRIALEGEDDLSLLAGRIDATTARLEQAMTQMQVQASNIAHDLRTPLARLRAQIETSLTALIEKDRPVSSDDLGAALEQIDHISGTFNALLRLARIESGTGRDAFEPVDLGAVAHQVAEMFAPVIEEAGQSLTLDVANAATIPGDPNLLVQMLSNLLQNALRYGPEDQDIILRAHGHGFTVIDQGPGIAANDREKVLQPLYQLESTRQGLGFGLGLSLVRAICELHGAELVLSDGPNGLGLTVSIHFAPS